MKLEKYLSKELKITQNLILGRAWTKQDPKSVQTYTESGEYNFNNILLHLKEVSNSELSQLKPSWDGSFNTSRYFEKKALAKVYSFLGLDFSSIAGYITSGGTESNIYSLWLARNWSRSSQNNKKTFWLVPDNCHYSIYKALDILGIYYSQSDEVISIKSDDGITPLDEITNFLSKLIKNQRCILIQTAMTTELGMVDPVREIGTFLVENNFDNVFYHIDACYGGLFLPFVKGYEDIFSSKSISTISVDTYKNFQGPTGTSIVLCNNDYYKYSRITSSYIKGGSDYTLTGSRNGIKAIQLYTILETVTKNSRKKEVSHLLSMTKYLYKSIRKLNFFNILYDPKFNYINLTLTTQGEHFREQILKTFKEHSISSSRTNFKGSEQEVFKIIVNPHVDKSVIDLFISKLNYE